MSIPVEEIKSRLNIVDIIGEYVRLQKAGANWKACCPFHNERTPSFVVNEDKQIYHCFGCVKGGDVISFVQEMDGLDFVEACKILAEKAGVEIDSRQVSQTDKNEKERLFQILDLATRFYETQLLKGMGKDSIMKYLTDRGLTQESIENFRLGYAPPGWRNLLDFLMQKGFSAEEISKTGLIVQKNDQEGNYQSADSYYDRFRERIIFPIKDILGRVVGHSARVAPGGDEKQAKYVNTPETVIYQKSLVLYGIDQAKQHIKENNFVLIVEGQMDVIAAHQAGIKNTIAVSGTALTKEQIKIIKRYTNNVKLLFDMDEAGQNANKRSAQLCFEEDVNVSVVILPGGKDAAELANDNSQALLDAVSNSLSAIDYFFGNIFAKYDKNKSNERKEIGREMVEIINSIDNGIERSQWIRKLAQAIEVEEKIIQDFLSKLNSRKIHSEENQDETSDSFEKKTREFVLLEALIHLMLTDARAFKYIFEKRSEMAVKYLLRNEIFKILIEKAEEAEFQFDKILGLIADSEIQNELRRINFGREVMVDINKNLGEYSLDEMSANLEVQLAEVKKEMFKEELEKITMEIRRAESDGDREKMMDLLKKHQLLLKETI